MSTNNPSNTTDDIPRWPKFGPRDMGNEIRLLKTRLRLLEDEIHIRFQSLGERLESLEKEWDSYIRD